MANGLRNVLAVRFARNFFSQTAVRFHILKRMLSKIVLSSYGTTIVNNKALRFLIGSHQLEGATRLFQRSIDYTDNNALLFLIFAISVRFTADKLFSC